MTDAIIIAVIALVLLLGGGWGGYSIASNHYSGEIATIQERDATALQSAEDRVTQSQKDHDNAVVQANQDVAHLAAANAASRDAFTDRVRALESALSRRPLPGSVGGAGQVPGSGPIPGGSGGAGSGNAGSDPSLRAAIDRFNTALKNYTVACGNDAENLTGVLDVAPKHP